MKVTAFHIAEQLRLKRLKEAYAGTLLSENPSELFYQVDEDRYLYAFDYGAVVFANMSDTDVSKNLNLLEQFCAHPLSEKPREDFEIAHRPEEQLAFGFDSLVVPHLSSDVVKIAMLNVAHSVALDFYSQRAHELLSEIQGFTNQMEEKGSISISRNNMLRFIGRTLNNKTRIVENLFIFDSPDLTWDDEYLDRIHRGLARTFETQTRFKEIEYTFKVVEDNLSVFRELYLHRESSKLEWIIIILICIEVVDLMISKIF
ncbi:MAG: RMD1 family protein [Saprospiraceae bacterium]|nr:RMD1 family protein [Saprospiraceae bacterium]